MRWVFISNKTMSFSSSFLHKLVRVNKCEFRDIHAQTHNLHSDWIAKRVYGIWIKDYFFFLYNSYEDPLLPMLLQSIHLFSLSPFRSQRLNKKEMSMNIKDRNKVPNERKYLPFYHIFLFGRWQLCKNTWLDFTTHWVRNLRLFFFSQFSSHAFFINGCVKADKMYTFRSVWKKNKWFCARVSVGWCVDVCAENCSS